MVSVTEWMNTHLTILGLANENKIISSFNINRVVGWWCHGDYGEQK